MKFLFVLSTSIAIVSALNLDHAKRSEGDAAVDEATAVAKEALPQFKLPCRLEKDEIICRGIE